MYVARMGENNNAVTLLAGQPERKRPLEIGRPRWEIIFILIKIMRWGLDSSGLGYLQVSGLCERGDEISSFTKCLNFFGYQRNPHRIKKDSAPWSPCGCQDN